MLYVHKIYVQTTKHINKSMTVYITCVYNKYLVTCVYTQLFIFKFYQFNYTIRNYSRISILNLKMFYTTHVCNIRVHKNSSMVPTRWSLIFLIFINLLLYQRIVSKLQNELFVTVISFKFTKYIFVLKFQFVEG